MQRNALSRHAGFQRHFQFAGRDNIQMQSIFLRHFIDSFRTECLTGVKYLVGRKLIFHGTHAFLHLRIDLGRVHYIQRGAIYFCKLYRITAAKNKMTQLIDFVYSFGHKSTPRASDL